MIEIRTYLQCNFMIIIIFKPIFTRFIRWTHNWTFLRYSQPYWRRQQYGEIVHFLNKLEGIWNNNVMHGYNFILIECRLSMPRNFSIFVKLMYKIRNQCRKNLFYVRLASEQKFRCNCTKLWYIWRLALSNTYFLKTYTLGRRSEKSLTV